MDTMPKTWFITGAGRGFGAEISRAALSAGHNVVATARNTQNTHDPDRQADHLLVATLDVTDTSQIRAAVDAAVQRFGSIDVLVNNAGYGQLGYFEEVSDEQIRHQFDTNVFGAMRVTKAILPIMRRQRSGRIVMMSSMGGFTALPGGSIYCSSKHALEGWTEGLSAEVAAFGIQTITVQPGFFRTDFLDPSSVAWGQHAIADYADISRATRSEYQQHNHRQPGSPAKLAKALLDLMETPTLPPHLIAGTDALNAARNAASARLDNAAQYESISTSLTIDSAECIESD